MLLGDQTSTMGASSDVLMDINSMPIPTPMKREYLAPLMMLDLHLTVDRFDQFLPQHQHQHRNQHENENERPTLDAKTWIGIEGTTS